MVVGSGPLADQIEAAGPAQRDRARAGQRRRAPVALRILGRPGGRLLRGLRADPGGGGRVRKAHRRLRWGGFLDTTVEGTTGVFFDQPEPRLIAEAVEQLATTPVGRRRR